MKRKMYFFEESIVYCIIIFEETIKSIKQLKNKVKPITFTELSLEIIYFAWSKNFIKSSG